MTTSSNDNPSVANQSTTSGGVSRRSLLSGSLGAALGLGAGALLGHQFATPTSSPDATASPSPNPNPSDPTSGAVTISAFGDHQAGIVLPATPQGHGNLVALTFTQLPTKTDLKALLGVIGEEIAALSAGKRLEVLPDGPHALTVTVGLGPRLMRLFGDGVPGAEELPAFNGDENLGTDNGGDLLLAAYSHDAGLFTPVALTLRALLPPHSLTWEQRVFRGPSQGTVVRNPFGFHDGVIVPRGSAEEAENIWVSDTEAPGFAGGTIFVLRQLHLLTTDFLTQDITAQEQVFGRKKITGAPLSGGELMDEVNLKLKDAQGEFLTPLNSHARAAHPSFTGSKLMFRRSFSYDNGPADSGLAFMSFQSDLRTFYATQHRLDEVDALMPFTRPRRSCTFFILPGFQADTPLGATLPD